MFDSFQQKIFKVSKKKMFKIIYKVRLCKVNFSCGFVERHF